MGDVDDPAFGSAARGTRGQNSGRAIRRWVRAGHTGLDHPGTIGARPHRGARGSNAREGRGAVPVFFERRHSFVGTDGGLGWPVLGWMNAPTPERSGSWKWWICGLLLLASTINYMDRQTLANASVRITTQFSLSQEQYGNLELAFGWAFAVGSIFFGVLADRFPLRWLYPVVLLLWSMAG